MTSPQEIVGITVLRNHRVRMRPCVPEVRELCVRRGVEFTAGGPIGHTAVPVVHDAFAERVNEVVLDDAGRVVRREGQFIPIGLLGEVADLLTERGYSITLKDRRKDSRRWVRCDAAHARLRRPRRELLDTLDRDRAVRAVIRSDEQIADTVAAIARVYPGARITVAVTTRTQLRRFRWLLRKRTAEMIGIYAAKKRVPGRLVVGLATQIPRGRTGSVDLLVLPNAVQATGINVLREVTSGRYRRVLSFSRERWPKDENVNWRMLVTAAAVWPAEEAKPPVTAVIVQTHGTRPDVMEDSLDQKRQLYWHNGRRNRRIAEVAKRAAAGTRKGIASLLGDAEIADQVVAAAGDGVMILVETPEHARELEKLLPGWAVMTADDLSTPEPNEKCGVICTELAAAETDLPFGVVIRATATRWPLAGDFDWPRAGDSGQKVLIDFEDKYHPVAAANSKSRVQSYGESGMTVWSAESIGPRTKRVETTGAS